MLQAPPHWNDHHIYAYIYKETNKLFDDIITHYES